MARPRSDIQPRIVHAARDRFLREGVDGASLRDIARDAGTNIGMIYYYFPTKDDLFFAVVEERYAGLLADMTTALARDAPVRERLRRLYRRVGRISHEELQVVQLVVREALVSSTRLARIVDRFRHGHLPLVMATLIDGRTAGVLDAALPTAVLFMATMALGAVPQLLRRILGPRVLFGDAPEGEALSDVLIDILFEGIGAKPQGSKRARSPGPGTLQASRRPQTR